jgi:uridine kinase
VKEYNFDHPDAMDQEAILQCLVNLKNRVPVEVPIYDFVTHRCACRRSPRLPGLTHRLPAAARAHRRSTPGM